jgi:protein TonB
LCEARSQLHRGAVLAGWCVSLAVHAVLWAACALRGPAVEMDDRWTTPPRIEVTGGDVTLTILPPPRPPAPPTEQLRPVHQQTPSSVVLPEPVTASAAAPADAARPDLPTVRAKPAMARLPKQRPPARAAIPEAPATRPRFEAPGSAAPSIRSVRSVAPPRQATSVPAVAARTASTPEAESPVEPASVRDRPAEWAVVKGLAQPVSVPADRPAKPRVDPVAGAHSPTRPSDTRDRVSEPAPLKPSETTKLAVKLPAVPVENRREQTERGEASSAIASREDREGVRNATIRKRPTPRYPRRCVRRGQEGVVVLRVRVLVDGSVGTVEVEKSSGVARLDAEAVRAMKRARFRPARRGGEPVVAWVTQPVRFTLRS